MYLCAGALVGPKTVVLPASCIHECSNALGAPSVISPAHLAVRVGSHLYDSGGTVISAQRSFEHPNYNSNTFDNDLAIIQLSQAVPATAKPIPYAGLNMPVVSGEQVVIDGWGATAGFVNPLNWLTISALSASDCAAKVAKSNCFDV